MKKLLLSCRLAWRSAPAAIFPRPIWLVLYLGCLCSGGAGTVKYHSQLQARAKYYSIIAWCDLRSCMMLLLNNYLDNWRKDVCKKDGHFPCYFKPPGSWPMPPWHNGLMPYTASSSRREAHLFNLIIKAVHCHFVKVSGQRTGGAV
jgi:hypothetical protein